MSSSFSLYILALFSFFLFVSTSSADAEATSNHSLSQNSNFRFAKKQAQKFYREFGLSPRLEANIVKDDPLVDASKIIEKRIRFPSLSDYETANSSGPNVQEFGHHAGYIKLNHTISARMFYYFFESRKNDTNAPVVVWLTGGPGCSSSLAMFFENGPFHLTDNLSLVWNDFGWDKESNIIFIDQPTGTGFSYTTDKSDIRTTSDEAAADFYDFIQAFFEMHPKYLTNDFYITGESYAGHYIPAFAARVHQGNKNRLGLRINLKGIAIGNGLTNPGIQYNAFPDYALMMKLINQSQYCYLRRNPVSTCLHELPKACDGTNSSACAQAYIDCGVILDDILSYNKNLSYYDIRKTCNGSQCYDFSRVGRFLNQESVKKALGVDENMEFAPCRGAVYHALLGDWMRNYEGGIPELLQDGIKLLIYAGEYDLVCNWLGNYDWVASLQWWGHNDFKWARIVSFKVNDVKAGLVKSHGPLTFLKVSNAGHLVPMDQPKASLEMLRKWLQGIPMWK